MNGSERKVQKRGFQKKVDEDDFQKDIELILSYLYNDYPWMDEKERLQNQRDFQRIIEQMRNVLQKRRQEIFDENSSFPDWVSKLLDYWIDNESDIITLNYDTCIERFLGSNHDALPSTETGATERLYPIPLRGAGRINGGTFSPDDLSIPTLYKLHGSFNWYYSGNQRFSGEPIYSIDLTSLTENSRERKQKKVVENKVPLIIPPVTDKGKMYDIDSLRLLWNKAYKVINNARNIYFMGYSFPKSDLTMRYFFSQVTEKEQSKTFVVNTKKAYKRYEELLDPSYFELIDNYAVKKINNEIDEVGPISDFVNDLISNKLRQ